MDSSELTGHFYLTAPKDGIVTECVAQGRIGVGILLGGIVVFWLSRGFKTRLVDALELQS